MALDHYLSQVHLRNFYSPVLGERMYGVRKSDMHGFTCRSEDVCRIEEGSTNEYLQEPRAIEEFLKTVEPKYNASIEKLRSDKIDNEAVYVIAGFVGYVATCSPAAMRINSGPLQGALEATAAILDEKAQLPKAPDSLGGKSLTELLKDGTVKFDIDQKYPQAIGISNIMGRVNAFGNFEWEVLVNDEPESPFFTSDFPVAIERTRDLRVLNRVVPLAPDLAILIKPDLEASVDDPKFGGFRSHRRKVRGNDVREVNRLIVQSAEKLVFYRDDHPWLKRFIERNSKFRIEPTIRKVRTAAGYVTISGQELTTKAA